MLPQTWQDLKDVIVASGLLSPEQIDEATGAFRDGGRDSSTAKDLAKFLVSGGHLTRYQAERLLAGRSHGFLIGGCRILDVLGSGGQGKVYRAVQTRLDRDVAVKVLSLGSKFDPQLVRRFEREARTAAQLNHPQIVQIFDYGKADAVYYIIMELAAGTTLKQRVTKHGPLSVDQSTDIVRQVATGLQHAHEHGIVHRDIKPANLVLQGSTVKILDLGLSRRLREDESITKDHSTLGTPDFMSPEQVQSAHDVDIRSDLYSLGCTWYYLLSGRPPFPDGTPIAKAMAHLNSTPEPLPNIVPDLPTKISGVIARLMKKDPADRFQTPADLLAELDSTQLPTTTQPLTSNEPPLVAGDSRDEPEAELSAQAEEDSQTLVRRPSIPAPLMVLQLALVMAALVLGGAYMGIRAIREHMAATEVIVGEQAAEAAEGVRDLQSTQTPNNESEAETATSSERATSARTTEAAGSIDETPDDSSADNAPSRHEVDHGTAVGGAEDLQHSASQSDLGTRGPRTAMVHADDGPTLQQAIAGAESGDTIQLAGEMTISSVVLTGRELKLEAAGPSRPVLIWQLPLDSPPSGFLFHLENAALQLSGIDLYVELTDRTASSGALVVFELNRSDLSMTDCTVTVRPSNREQPKAEQRVPVTFVSILGERDWRTTADENLPSPLTVRMTDSMVRGAEPAIRVNSRHAEVELRNSLIVGSGPALDVLHTREVGFAHHHVALTVESCTLNSEGELLRVESRPDDVFPTTIHVNMTSSILCSPPKGTKRPPIVSWDSPVPRNILSRSIVWTSTDNLYFHRGSGLQAKTSAGPTATYVNSSDDWEQVGLGRESRTSSVERGISIPRTTNWQSQTPKDYRQRAQFQAFGANVESLAEPERASN